MLGTEEDNGPSSLSLGTFPLLPLHGENYPSPNLWRKAPLALQPCRTERLVPPGEQVAVTVLFHSQARGLPLFLAAGQRTKAE